MPEYLGPISNFATKVVDGRLYAEVDGKLVEVVEAGIKEIAKLPYDLSEGLYVVGSGSTGAAESLAILGAGYFAVILASSLCMVRPHPSYAPAGMVKPTVSIAAPEALNLTLDAAVMTPQFHLLGVTLFGLAASGYGLFSVAKSMMSEVFSGLLPTVVTSAFAAKFLLTISITNLGEPASFFPTFLA
eukprot:gene12045-15340_t